MRLSKIVSYTNLMWLGISIQMGRFVRQNPRLFGMTFDPSLLPSEDVFRIFRSHPVLDRVLDDHRSDLDKDYEAYRNHCLRVLSFAVYHLVHADKKDHQQQEEDARTERKIDLMAFALAYHDMGLWTDHKLDYLEPSATRMALELDKYTTTSSSSDEPPVFDWTADEIATIREVILQHHKYTHWFSTDKDSVVDEVLVNAVRKADWADATWGVFKFHLPVGHVEAAYNALPEANFHIMLAGMGSRLSPDSIRGRLDVLNIFKF